MVDEAGESRVPVNDCEPGAVLTEHELVIALCDPADVAEQAVSEAVAKAQRLVSDLRNELDRTAPDNVTIRCEFGERPSVTAPSVSVGEPQVVVGGSSISITIPFPEVSGPSVQPGTPPNCTIPVEAQ